MKCTKCWYINEKDNPYHPEVYGKLSQEDIDDLNGIIKPLEHDKGCDKGVIDNGRRSK